MRILDIINEIRDLYVGNFPYEYFDSKQQVLKDLDDTYQSMVQSDFGAAEKLKWTRITGIFLGASKDQVRSMDEDFFEEDVLRRFSETNPELMKLFQGTQRVEMHELDGLLDDTTPSLDIKAFATKLVNDISIADGQTLPDMSPEYQEIQKQAKLAADEIITEQKRATYLAEPVDVLVQIQNDLEKIRENYGEISGMHGFNSGKFMYQFNKVKTAMEELGKTIARDSNGS